MNSRKENGTMKRTHGFFTSQPAAALVAAWVLAALCTPCARAQSETRGEAVAEQAYKNIQVLKGVPASQIRTMMGLMNASLGVRCDACHVPNQMEKDDKENKKTARKMIQMVLDTNEQAFNGHTEITCYTCHRGQVVPVTTPVIGSGLTPPPPPPPAAKAGEGLPGIDQILQKYQAAAGDPGAFGKLKSRVMKGMVTDARGESHPVEVLQASPDKMATLVRMPKGTMGSGYNGKTGWNKNQRGLTELVGLELLLMRRNADFGRALNLGEELQNPRVTGRTRVGDRPAYAVSARTEGQRVQLCFDAETGQLLRRTVMIGTPIGALPQQTDYENYKEVDGVRLPMVVRFTGPDPNSATTTVYQEVTHNVSLDEARFSAPQN